MNMNMNNNTNNKALVVHSEDDKPSSSSSTGGLVLDALPYVEALDPNYENYAISLIEEELSNNVETTEQQILNHPSLRKTNGINSHTSPNFGGNAPLAMAAYEQLVRRKEANGDEEEDTTANPKKPYFEINRPNPMSSIDSTTSTTNISEEELISNLQTSIKTSKIQFEILRNTHMNLELNSNIQSSTNYTSYAQLLQNNYLNTTQVAVENQRHVVDGINGSRMEEQRVAIDKLHGMNVKYDNLVDKNRRLGIAVTNLEAEVSSLKKSVGGDDDVGVVKNVVEEDGDTVMGGE